MCQQEVRHALDENGKLKEKVRMQEEELAEQKVMTSRASEGQPSLTPTKPKLVNSSHLPLEFVTELWGWEFKNHVPQELFQLYEVQCQLFFVLTGLKRAEWIDHIRFHSLWQQSVEWGVENLFVEILARRQINLSDPYSAFIIIGDFGARILLYYASLENRWILRHQFPIPTERREVSWQEYGTQVTSQFYGQPLGSLQQWQDTLQILLAQLQHPDFVSEVMSANMQRLSLVPSEGFTGSHYIFQLNKTVNRLERYLKEMATQRKPLLNLNSQIQFELPPAGFVLAYQTIDFPIVGTPLTLRYLGQYNHMFDSPAEEPIPTWTAITWLLEDYGLSRDENVPADIHYRRISSQWSLTPPAAVGNHPHYCPCPRRYKWSPTATLSSIEYNWPIIPGPKSNSGECAATYKQFFQNHVQHRDPVCYKASVFSNILANWCEQWHVTIDVNQFHESHHEFFLLLKLQYRPTRWVRLVEAMAISHFIAGAHKCLINEFPHTRAGPFERFLRWQRTNAPALVALDEDLRRAIEKMEERELKRATEQAVQNNERPPKMLRR